MKRWIIVDVKSLEIQTEYESELQREFGGPWGDSSKTMHLIVPSALVGKPVKVQAFDHTELVDEEGDTIVDLVPGPIQVAYDSKGQKILNEQGKPTLVSSWEYKPRMGAALKVVSK